MSSVGTSTASRPDPYRSKSPGAMGTSASTRGSRAPARNRSAAAGVIPLQKSIVGSGHATAIKAYDAAFPAENDKSRSQYLKLKAEQQAVFAKLDKAVAGNAFGSPPLRFFSDPMTRYPAARKLMDDGEQAGKPDRFRG